MVVHGVLASIQGRGAGRRVLQGVYEVIIPREETGRRERLAPWLKRPRHSDSNTAAVRSSLERAGLWTVCESAVCPNLGECWAERTATFLILGKICTRNCSFCAVGKGETENPDPKEPKRLSLAAAELRLRHVVITSVTRDDLPDGGAGHFASCVRAVKEELPRSSVEVLTPDFAGREEPVARVMESGPDVFGHNLETVERLSREVRPQADYSRSLRVLSAAAGMGGRTIVKSGIMLGLGETESEVEAALRDMLKAGVAVVTLGQYLKPGPGRTAVERYVPPEEFDGWRSRALEMGFAFAAAGPFTRSSHRAREAFEAVRGAAS